MGLPKNVLGSELEVCCSSPMTGFFRDGYCRTGMEDVGLHLVCAIMTDDFLQFSKSVGNDLSTPIPDYQFPGLDVWRPMVFVRDSLEGSVGGRVRAASSIVGDAHVGDRICFAGRLEGPRD